MLKGAIVGFGKIARTNHLPAFGSAELQNKFNITSAVDVDRQIREIGKNTFEKIKFYESLDKMYESEIIDFVDITTPPKYHKDIIEWAIEKQLHIVCEKPFTVSFDEAKQLYDKIKNSKSVFSPCHQYKYSPLWSEFKKYLDEKDDNEKVFIQLNVFRTGADPGINIETEPWRLNKEISGGGILSDTGFHYLYLSNWLMGKPNKVTTINYNLAHKQYEVEDTSQVILEYQQGIIQINLSWSYHARRNEAKLISKNGSLFYDGKNYIIKSRSDKKEKIPVPDASDKTYYTELYVKLFSDFNNLIQNHDHNSEGLTEAYNTIYLLDKCYKSAQQQKTIELK